MMEEDSPYQRGCLVHFQDAREGDIVVCLRRDRWDQLDSETKSILSPFGIINFIGGERYRKADVAWREEPTHFQKYRQQFMLWFSLMCVAFVLGLFSCVVRLWDEAKADEMSSMAILIFLGAIYGIVLLTPSPAALEEREKKNNAYSGMRRRSGGSWDYYEPLNTVCAKPYLLARAG